MVEHLLSLDGGLTIINNFTWSDLGEVDSFYSSTSSGAIILVAASFFALIISIPGLQWHIKNRNLPAASMVGWIVLLNLMNIINALIWPNDDVDSWWDGQIYCDIEIKLEIAATMGLVGSLACIMRSLARALDTTNIRLMPSKGQRVRQLVLHITLCVGLPLLVALLHFVLQPLRYYVFAIAGCKASYSNSWCTMLLGYIWPPVICVLNAYYACLLTIRLYRYRRDYASVLSASSSGMTKSRFLRLLVSAGTVLLIVIPVQAYALYFDVASGLSDTWSPPSWQTIVYVPTFGAVFPDRWVRLGIAIPVFLCWGWGRDAKSIYQSWLHLLGLAKLFPTLAQPVNTPTLSPARNKKASLASSTLFSKARSLIFSLSKRSATSNTPPFGVNPNSDSSSPDASCAAMKRVSDIESQNCSLVEKEGLSIDSAISIGHDEITPVEADVQARSWEDSQRALKDAAAAAAQNRYGDGVV